MENGIRFDLEYETMPWHRVDAVVFDIGNILIRYAPKDFLEQLFPGDAQKQQDMLTRVYNGPYWERFDRGEMEYAEAARRLAGSFSTRRTGSAAAGRTTNARPAASSRATKSSSAL